MNHWTHALTLGYVQLTSLWISDRASDRGREKVSENHVELILTGYAGGIRVLVRVLHVLHKGLAAEEQLVADRTAGCIWAANQGGVLLEHNTLLQLLFRSTLTRGHQTVTPRIPPESCEPEAQDRRAQNRTIPVRVKAPMHHAATIDFTPCTILLFFWLRIKELGLGFDHFPNISSYIVI